MFNFRKKPDLYEYSAAELQEALAARRVVLIDVREPGEHAAARIEGSINLPLSAFDPAALPEGELVLHCAGGKRSRLAAEQCARAGIRVSGHLAGGLAAWQAARLPVQNG